MKRWKIILVIVAFCAGLYFLEACGGGGSSSQVPAAPTGLHVDSTTENSVILSWRDNAADETGFYVERGLALAGSFSKVATLGENEETYTQSGLSSGTDYYYRVCAYNDDGDSPYSNVVVATTHTDDLMTEYFTYTYNSSNNWIHNVVYNSSGPDLTWFTGDDVVEYHITLDREIDESWAVWTRYVGMGDDDAWFTEDDLVEHYTLYTYIGGKMVRGDRYDENDVFYGYFTNSYSSTTGERIRTSDYDNLDQLLEYDVFSYDLNGNQVFEANYTGGDSVNYYFLKSYNNDGKLLAGTRYDSPGDGNWFDDNDIIGYHYRYYYNSSGYSYKFVRYSGYGQDGEWKTADDVIDYYYLYSNDSHGNRIRGDKYTDSGNNGVWFQSLDGFKGRLPKTQDDTGD